LLRGGKKGGSFATLGKCTRTPRTVTRMLVYAKLSLLREGKREALHAGALKNKD
jgi:hypothetical protein